MSCSIHTLLDHLPCNCLLCGSLLLSGAPLCGRCRTDLLANLNPCPHCALPHAGPHGLPCGHCLRQPPPWQAAWAPFRYAQPLSALIGSLKFRGRIGHARLLGGLMAETAPRVADVQLLLPVPLHPTRLAERGYNQALELARPLARRLGLPLQPQLARRIRHTPPQSDLGARERRHNLRGAFEVSLAPYQRRIAIIDDVITTGTTVAELSRCLQRAGAERVEVWALARAGPAQG